MTATTQPLPSTVSIGCRDPRCMLPATTIVTDSASRSYAFCDEHAAYYIELEAETVETASPVQR